MGSHPRATKRPCLHAPPTKRSPDQEPCSSTFQHRLRNGLSAPRTAGTAAATGHTGGSAAPAREASPVRERTAHRVLSRAGRSAFVRRDRPVGQERSAGGSHPARSPHHQRVRHPCRAEHGDRPPDHQVRHPQLGAASSSQSGILDSRAQLPRVRQDFDRGISFWSRKVWKAVGGLGEGVSWGTDRVPSRSMFTAMAVRTCCRWAFGCPW